MKLIYRGIPYEASFHEPAADIEQAGRSRRPTTRESQSTKEQLRRPGNELTYRGVRYKP